jgi:hypothetical protein
MAQGLLHMECEFRTPYKRRILEAYAPHSLKVAKEVLGRYLKDGILEGLQDASRSIRKPVVLGYEDLRGLSNLSHTIYKDINRAIIYALGSSHAYIQQNYQDITTHIMK